MDGCFAGLDIGGTKTTYMLRGAKGDILRQYTLASTGDLSLFRARVDELIAGFPVLALGAGVPGRTDSARGIVLDAPGLGWRNLNLKETLFAGYPFPCGAENDVNAALMAERAYGCVSGVEDAVFLALGTGVGAAILCGGKIIEGASCSAGEVGYWLFDEAEAEGCAFRDGDFGALENRISGTGLNALARRAGTDSRALLSLGPRTPGQQEVLDRFLLRLSMAAANLISLLNPKILVLGGGVSESLGAYLGRIRENVARMTPIPSRVEISAFGNRAGALGACALAESLI